MKKNILIVLLTAAVFAFNSGCTSSDTPEDEQAIENADAEKIEPIDGEDTALSEGENTTDIVADTTTEAPADAGAADAAPTDDASLEASLNDPSLGSDTPAETQVAQTPAPDAPAENTDAAATDITAGPTVDEAALGSTTEAPPVADSQFAPDTSSLGSDTSTSTPIESLASSEPRFEPTPVSKPAAKPGSALKKVALTAPYQAKDGGWVNTVYIARPGEKLIDISMKIFGADRTADLKAITENNYLKWRAPRGGDKIYYVSPNRPDDSAATKLYYEDMGMVPETYVAKQGESLRKVAKELLGYDNAWKEVWTSNIVESKTTLKDGETLRYWKSGGEIMAAMTPSPPPMGATVTDSAPAATAVTTPPTADTSGAPSADSAALPPPPADANAQLPSPPPTDTVAATTDAPPPPPPVEEEVPPPPPADLAAADEPKGAEKLEEAAAEEEEGLNNDAMMSMGALGILVALLAFVIIKKKKQKAQMNNLEMNA